MAIGLSNTESQVDQSNSTMGDDDPVVMDKITNLSPNGVPNPQQDEGNESQREASNSSDRADRARIRDTLNSVAVSTDLTKDKIIDFAYRAMEDLLMLSEEFNPFDIQPSDRRLLTANANVRNYPGSEYLDLEVSRETIRVGMDRQSIVEMLMDINKYAAKFADLVARATLLTITHPGETESYHRTLYVMSAEFHIPAPVVPARESYFVRFCEQLCSDTWGVVDVSLESFFPYQPSARYRRRPSGCIIKEHPDGSSEVTWVELVEADHRFVHNIFQPAVCSGYAFGAQRWVGAIAREYNSLQALMNTTPSEGGLPVIPESQTSLLKLTEKMMRVFFADASASSMNVWVPLPLIGDGEIKVMVRNVGQGYEMLPSNKSVVLSTSVAIPAPPSRVFDFLSDPKSRPKWDMLSLNRVIRESARFTVGENQSISILEIKNVRGSGITTSYRLQKSYTHPTFSYIAYVPIDALTMSTILSGDIGDDVDSVMMLTSGFAIFPNRPIQSGEESIGSLLTVMLHIIDSVPGPSPYALSVHSLDVAHGLISGTVELIKDHVAPGRPSRNVRVNGNRT